MFHGSITRRIKRYIDFHFTVDLSIINLQQILKIEPLVEVKEMEEVTKSEEAEQDSEHSESESFETCDSGVSDDEGSVKSESSQPLLSSSNSQRTRSLSDSEFSDALDRSIYPFP